MHGYKRITYIASVHRPKGRTGRHMHGAVAVVRTAARRRSWCNSPAGWALHATENGEQVAARAQPHKTVVPSVLRRAAGRIDAAYMYVCVRQKRRAGGLSADCTARPNTSSWIWGVKRQCVQQTVHADRCTPWFDRSRNFRLTWDGNWDRQGLVDKLLCFPFAADIDQSWGRNVEQ